MKQQTSTVNEENEEFMLHCLVSCRDIVRNLQESLFEPFFDFYKLALMELFLRYESFDLNGSTITGH